MLLFQHVLVLIAFFLLRNRLHVCTQIFNVPVLVLALFKFDANVSNSAYWYPERSR